MRPEVEILPEPMEILRAAATRQAERRTIALPPMVSASELYSGEMRRLPMLLEDLLWDGLTMLIAKPKAGKSWLMLQIAAYIAGGSYIEGVEALDQGPVIYGAFEEPAARTAARLKQISLAGEWTKNLHFIYELLPLMGGGADQLGSLIEKLKPRLVALDTLTALVKGGSRRESDVFRSQYAEVTRIRKLAEDAGTAVLLSHHVRKGASEGAIDAVAGTGGIAAAVDTLWYLRRKPEGEATLEVVGRETEERTFALRFDREPFGWRFLGDDAALLVNAERREVMELIREDGPQTPKQIAAELGKNRGTVRMLLKRMADDGQLARFNGKYQIPSLSMSDRVTERESK